jgi:hypothetical protein
MLASMNQFAFGCTDPQESVVSTTTNAGQESRLLISTDHETQAPSFEFMICLAPDSNNAYVNELEQELV